jgi:hypothetical protein
LAVRDEREQRAWIVKPGTREVPFVGQVGNTNDQVHNQQRESITAVGLNGMSDEGIVAVKSGNSGGAKAL